MREIELFMETLHQEDFAQGHEVLEDKWREWKAIPDKREESFILKGLINGATALALVKLGRQESALKVWETYEKYRPLIDTIHSVHTKEYKEACVLLEVFYKKVMIHTNE